MGSATKFGEVRLAWARDREGRRVHVGELDPARRRERAPFACPGCGEALVARLGRVRARHFGHHPGSRCPLTAPETALHWNAKERLLALCEEALAGRRRVELRARCPSCRRATPRPLAAFGDAAGAEGAAGQLRCDVLVTRDGRPALALEVRVTHGIGEKKEAALAGLGLPVAELDARGEWLRELPGEEGGLELVPARSLGFDECPACQVAERARAEREAGGDSAAVAELEAYRARGLLGPRPGPAKAQHLPIPDPEYFSLRESFRCPDCKGLDLLRSERIVRHDCPGKGSRTVAWRGYDGLLVRLGWWRSD